MPKALLTGETGFVAGALLQELLRRDGEVRVGTRSVLEIAGEVGARHSCGGEAGDAARMALMRIYLARRGREKRWASRPSVRTRSSDRSSGSSPAAPGRSREGSSRPGE